MAKISVVYAACALFLIALIGTVPVAAASVEKIAYSGGPGEDPMYGVPPGDRIHIMNTDGTGVTWSGGIGDEDECGPSWSPDGSRIAFYSEAWAGLDDWAIFLMKPDGSGRTRLVVTASPYTSFLRESPAWSPDGSRIAFTSWLDGEKPGICTIALDGTGPTRLSAASEYDLDPSWSPDGSRIAFTSMRDNNYEICVMNADGTEKTYLTADGASDHSPAWSPDGSRIAFVSDRDGNDEIYAMSPDGTGQSRLTADSRSDRDPAWSPDGSRIVFARGGVITIRSTDGAESIVPTPRYARYPAWGVVSSPHVPPIAAFSYSPSSITAGSTVQFSDDSSDADGTIASRLWRFGWMGYDGTSTEPNPSHTYQEAGDYYGVELIVTDNDGNVARTTRLLTVNPPAAPVATFETNVTSGKAPLPVQFTDTSANLPTSWNWVFGDGASSTLQNPVHTYAKPGIYTVALTVTNAEGTNTVTRVAAITALKSGTQPVAGFAWSSPATAGVPVQFTDTSTGTVTAWSWSIGGRAYPVQNPVHTFTSVGDYRVTLRVKGPQGWSQTLTRTVTVQAPDLPLAADFTVTPTTGRIPLSVQFTDTSTGAIVSRRWSFGDGTASTLQNPLHTYRKAGTYTVRLTVTDASGKTADMVKGDFIIVTPRR